MKKENKKISIVIPIFNEEDNIGLIVKRIEEIIPNKYIVEFILVDDGSLDGSREKINELTINPNIKSIFFYKNFGHQSALVAGINYSTGDAVITIDADFQHPPETIVSMIEKWEQGSDVVVGQKIEDNTSGFLLKIIRYLGYQSYKLLTGNKLIPGVSDFRLIDKSIIKYLKQCTETRFVLRGLVSLPAKQITVIPYRVGKRKFGKSGYSIIKLLNLYIYSITSFSIIPLRLATLTGLTLIFLSFIYLLYVVWQKIFGDRQIIEGWTAIIFLIVILFGFVFMYLGLIGEYLGAIFEDIKHRPKYLIESTKNINEPI